MNELSLIRGGEIAQLLRGQEDLVLEAVKDAYSTHARKHSIMPPNSYLYFPEKEKERIIAKVAYLGGRFQEAGIKWIASFPGNLNHGLERASATLILNDIETGYPTAILESSIISAKRTAASAALGAKYLRKDKPVSTLGIIGCGLINFETLRFVKHLFPEIKHIKLLDLSAERASQFGAKVLELNPDLNISQAKDQRELFSSSEVVAIGTTAVHPFIDSLEDCREGTVVLHTSLRDLTEAVIEQADNVVDDIDQVCSNNTSLHLTEQKTGNRDFIRCSIGDLINGEAPEANPDKKVHVFSPFGLGVLDLAVGNLVKNLARKKGIGINIEGFIPKPWTERV